MLACALGSLVVCAPATAKGADRHDNGVDAVPARGAGLAAAYARRPLTFERARGRYGRGARFVARGRRSAILLSDRAATMFVSAGKGNGAATAPKPDVVRMRLAGARQRRLRPTGRTSATANHLIGRDPRRWQTRVPQYSRVRATNVYPGVDLVYRGTAGRLEYDFRIAPGADARDIRLRFSGARRIALDGDGALVIRTAGGLVRQPAPVVYQPGSGGRRRVAGGYVVHGRQVGFRLGSYDRRRALVIDPVLSYSTYLGGSADDIGYAVAADASGAAYVTGQTMSPDLPARGGAQKELKGGTTDAFVAKLRPDGSLDYTTYLGGAGEERGAGIAVGPGGAYVAGLTTSTDFPTTAGAFKRTGSGAFVAKLGPDGAGLAYSTLLGPASAVGGVAVDSAGRAYATGQTTAADFPAKNAYQAALRGPTDAFVSRLAPDGSALEYSTFLGGSDGSEAATGIRLGAAGAAYVAGLTSATDFPTKSPIAGHANLAGKDDAFVTKLDTGAAGASSLVYSTYLGGQASDVAYAIDVAPSGAAYVTGATRSGDFPVKGAYQPTKPEGHCFDPTVGLAPQIPCASAFVAALDPGGSALEYSTFLGGTGAATLAPVLDGCLHTRCPSTLSFGGCRVEGCNRGNDAGYSIAAGASGRAYVAGRTISPDFPTTATSLTDAGRGECRTAQSFSQYRPPEPCADAFVSELDTTAAGPAALRYSTLLGGNRDEWINGIALDADGGAYITGQTDSNDLPTVQASQRDPAGEQPGIEAFVARIAIGAPAGPMVRDLGARGGPTGGGTQVVISGSDLRGATAVSFGGAAALSFAVDPSGSRIAAVSPPHAEGVVDVTVTTSQGTTPRVGSARFSYGTGGWTPTGSLKVARRAGHTATLLADGRVLVAGGCCDPTGQPLRSAELYDPRTGRWSGTGELHTARFDHTATLILGTPAECGTNCGKVLVTGGWGPSLGPGGTAAPTTTAELYDPATGSWKQTADLGPCTALPVSGGTSPTCGARYGHTATQLRGGPEACGRHCGKVLVAGGYQPAMGGPYLRPDRRPALLFDPVSETWSATGPFNGDGRAFHSATLISSADLGACGSACGKVLTVSGLSNTFSFPRPEAYDPKTETWTLTQPTAPGGAPPPTEQIPRLFHTASPLANGEILYAGGNPGMNAGSGTDTPTGSAEIYNPALNAWRLTGLMNTARFGQTAAVLPSGKVLVAGGFNRGPLASAEAWDPASGKWSSAASMLIPRGIADLGLPMDPGCESTDAHAPRNYCGGGAEGQPIFSTPGPTATLLSSDPGGFKADQAICGTACGKVLVVGGTSSPITELYDPSPSTPGAPGPGANPPGAGTVPPSSRKPKRPRRPSALARCLKRAAHHKSAARRRAARRRCRARYGPRPGRVMHLRARRLGKTRVRLTFRAAGSAGKRPPPARRYALRQSRRPIRSHRAFRRAHRLCGGVCRFRPRRVGQRLTLTITHLRPRTRYYYAVAAIGRTGRRGPRSRTVRVRTR